MDIRPLILVDFGFQISGGDKRTYEILKRGKSNGVNYVVVFNKRKYDSATKNFPLLDKVLHQYTLYMVDWGADPLSKIPGSSLISDKHIINSAVIMSRIAKNEGVDLIVSDEDYPNFLRSYFTGTISHLPWTAIFNLTPTVGYYGSITSNNSPWSLVNKMLVNIPLHSRIRLLGTLFSQLKISQKTLILTVSESVEKEVNLLNPKIKIHVIKPGCGVDIKKYKEIQSKIEKNEAIFSSRLIPGKGLLDLPETWNIVIKKIPDAKLFVAGIVQERKWIDMFHMLIKKYGLSKNIIFVGQYDMNHEKDLVQLIKSSKVLIYPSLQDSFSLSILESLICGTPVVAYDIPAIQSNYKECKAVIRVGIKNKRDMARHIIRILEDEEEWIKLSLEARSFAEKYDWDEVTKAEKDAYVAVLNLEK